MTTLSNTDTPMRKTVYWLPRILCMLAIAFISLFALDAFAPGQTLGQQLAAFAVHLIPSFALALLLIFSWRHEKWGGVLFLLIGLVFTPIIFNWNYRMNNSVWISLSIIALITLPFVVVGILFLVDHAMNRKD